ncbi:hypothetical protein D3C80_1098890 [compost metagenome]
MLTTLHIDRDLEAAKVAVRVGQVLQVFTDHAPRHRVDGRFTHSQHQPRPGHRAHAAAGDKTNARFRQQAHLAIDQGTVGHVRVVTRILEGAGFGALADQAAEFQAHLHDLAFGQGDVHRIVTLPGEQQLGRCQAGGGGAAAGGKAAAQRRGLFAGFFTHRRVSVLREG